MPIFLRYFRFKVDRCYLCFTITLQHFLHRQDNTNQSISDSVPPQPKTEEKIKMEPRMRMREEMVRERRVKRERREQVMDIYCSKVTKVCS